MKLLLTGATGFIGQALLPLLFAAGHQVQALARRLPGRMFGQAPGADESGVMLQQGALPAEEKASPAQPPVTWIQGSLPEPGLCAMLCAGQDAVIHAAGLAHVNAAAAALRSQNLDATLQLAHAARDAGVRHFLFLSSSKARYPAHSHYARLKAEAETALLALQSPDFRVLCLRPCLVYGPGMRGNLAALLRVLQRPTLPLFPRSQQPLGLIGVNDLATSLVTALQSTRLSSGAWDLSDGESYTLDQIVYHVRRHLALPQPALGLPRQLLYGAALLAPLLSSLYRSPFSMSTYRTLFEEAYQQDPDFARLTGFQPRDTFYSLLPALLTGAAQ